MSVLRNQQLGIPFGMAYPLTFGGKTFQENFDYGREIKDNLRNLLLTQKGERRNLNFGTDAKYYLDMPNIGLTRCFCFHLMFLLLQYCTVA